MRLFIAILFPDIIKKALDRSARQIARDCGRGRVTDSENYHLTLRFLGETAAEALPSLQRALAAAAAASDPFYLVLNGFGEFKKPDGSIVWLGLKENPAALTALSNNLENELLKAGYPREGRPFSPHITLIRQARLKKPLGELAPPFEAGRLAVRQIALMESCRVEGRLTYIPLAAYPLKSR